MAVPELRLPKPCLLPSAPACVCVRMPCTESSAAMLMAWRKAIKGGRVEVTILC